MKITCTLTFDYKKNHHAEQILKATKVDDDLFVTAQVSVNTVKATIESDSFSSMVHTLDDYLACVSVAEKIVNKN